MKQPQIGAKLALECSNDSPRKSEFHEDRHVSAGSRSCEGPGTSSNTRWGSVRNLQRYDAHFFVDQPVCGDDDGAAKLERIPSEIRDFAAGLFDQQNAR